MVSNHISLVFRRLNLLFCFLFLTSFFLIGQSPARGEDSRYFPETGKTVTGKFLEYWNVNGGLPVFGLPITEAQMEVNQEDGKTYLTQWFERHRLELHPENAGTKFEILTGLLGKDLKREALPVDPDFQHAEVLYNAVQPKDQQWYFEDTGHNLRFRFLEYWQQNGGLERFGFPISEEYREIDPETNQVFIVQWFERARFEYHPENKRPYDVLLGLLGKQIKKPSANGLEQIWKKGGVPFNSFNSPSGIAIDSKGYVYIADGGSKRILKYDGLGHFVARFSTDIPSINTGPNGRIAVDSKGNIFVATRNGDPVIIMLNNKGEFLQSIQPAGRTTGIDPADIEVDPDDNLYVLSAFSSLLLKFKIDRYLNVSLDWQRETPGFNDITIDSKGNLYAISSRNRQVQKYDPAGNLLQQFGEFGQNDAGFDNPQFIAVDGVGNVYVGDMFKNTIQKYDQKGNFILKWGGKGTQPGQFGSDGLSTITPLVVDGAGFVYVSDVYNNRIQKFDGNGNFLLKWGDSANLFNRIRSLALDKAGQLYVADNNRIQKFSASGVLISTLTNPDSGEGQFNGSPLITLDDKNNLYVVDFSGDKILKIDPTGRFILKWGGQGSEDGQLYSIGHFTTDRSGNIYVSDWNNGNPRIQKFDSNGKFIFKLGGKGQGKGNGQFSNIAELVIDAQNNLMVADTDGPSVQKFDSNGKFLERLNFSQGQGEGQLNGIGTFSIDAQGNYFVLGGTYIHKFDNNWHFLYRWDISDLEIGSTLRLDGNGNFYTILSGDRIAKFHLN